MGICARVVYVIVAVAFLIIVFTNLVDVPKPAGQQDGPTLEGFKQIQLGMPIEEVQKLLGSEGELTYVTEYPSLDDNVPARLMEMRRWGSTRGVWTYVSVTFIDGKVDSKSQSGLYR